MADGNAKSFSNQKRDICYIIAACLALLYLLLRTAKALGTGGAVAHGGVGTVLSHRPLQDDWVNAFKGVRVLF